MESNCTTNRLKSFKDTHKVTTKGPLALMVQLTHMTKEKSFPLNTGDFLTENKGQVVGLGGSNLKRYSRNMVLHKHLLRRAGGQAEVIWA